MIYTAQSVDCDFYVRISAGRPVGRAGQAFPHLSIGRALNQSVSYIMSGEGVRGYLGRGCTAKTLSHTPTGPYPHLGQQAGHRPEGGPHEVVREQGLPHVLSKVLQKCSTLFLFFGIENLFIFEQLWPCIWISRV